jgi:hypothetical protein
MIIRFQSPVRPFEQRMRSPLVTLAMVLWLPSWLGAAGPNAQTWEPNNTVRALALDGQRLFLGGDFTTLGPHTGNSALFLTTTGQLQTSFPFFEHFGGWGRCAISDGAGGWYVSSDADQVNNADGSPGLSGRLIHVLANGRVDTLFSPSPDGPVNGLALYNGRLYVGGGFGTIGGQPQAYLAALSPTNGALLPWNPGLDAGVNGSCLTNGLLYVGGDFSQAGGGARSRLACFDLSGPVPALTAWNPGANGTVERITATASLAYAAGAFTVAGGMPRNYFVEMDTLSGTATSFDAQVPALPTSQGWALALDNGHLYIGGAFALAGGQARANAACFDLPTAGSGTLDAWQANTDTGPVETLLRDGSFVYLGGAFAQVNGVLRHNLARVDASSGAVDAWDPCVGGPVDGLCLFSGGQLLVQGLFWQAGGVDRQGLACLDLGTGLPDPFVCDLTRSAGTASAKALTLSGSVLLVGGAFDGASGTARSNLVAVDAGSGTPLAWAPNPDGEVRALAVDSSGPASTVYLGGAFANAGGAARPGLAAISFTGEAGGGGASGAAAFNPGCDGTVQALLLDHGDLYVGGSFGTLGGAPRANLGAVDAVSGSAVAFDPEPNSSVFALAGNGGALFVGGAFTQVGGLTRQRLARLNADGSADAAFTAQNGSGPINGSVLALAQVNNVLYYGGAFTPNHVYAVMADSGIYARAAQLGYIWAGDTVLALAGAQVGNSTANNFYLGGPFLSLLSSYRTFFGSELDDLSPDQYYASNVGPAAGQNSFLVFPQPVRNGQFCLSVSASQGRTVEIRLYNSVHQLAAVIHHVAGPNAGVEHFCESAPSLAPGLYQAKAFVDGSPVGWENVVVAK